LYKITPLKVNVVSVVFKWRNNRKLVRRAYKKAIITLSQKDKIDVAA
jgi:ribosomal protein L23